MESDLFEKRIFWIDALRGIGIFLVVLGHTFWKGHNVIYAFHMPLFFFISGILFKTGGEKNILIKR